MSWGACYLSVEAGGNILVPYGVLITMFHYRRFNRSLVVIHTLKWVTVISTQHLYHYNDVIMSTIASEITSLTIVYSDVKRKHQSSASLSFVQGTGEFPAQMASNAENVSIWWRHHVSASSFREYANMMTSPTRNIFCVTGPLWGEFAGHQWIPVKKASDAELWCFLLICTWLNGWANHRDAGDLRRHHAHYDVTSIWSNVSCWLHVNNISFVNTIVRHK